MDEIHLSEHIHSCVYEKNTHFDSSFHKLSLLFLFCSNIIEVSFKYSKLVPSLFDPSPWPPPLISSESFCSGADPKEKFRPDQTTEACKGTQIILLFISKYTPPKTVLV